MSEITVVEAYNKFNKQLVILISGLSGSKKNETAKEISKLFKIPKINLRDYMNKDSRKEVTLPNDEKVIDSDHIDSYDWEKFNESINKIKSKGIIVTGTYFPKNKINFTINFHIHIKISKHKYIEMRHIFLKENEKKFKELYDLIDTPTESLIINKLIYPHYLEYTQESIINKWINGNEKNLNEIIDITFNYLIENIQKYLDNYDKNKKYIKKEKILSSSTTSEEMPDEFLIAENVDPKSIVSAKKFFSQ